MTMPPNPGAGPGAPGPVQGIEEGLRNLAGQPSTIAVQASLESIAESLGRLVEDGITGLSVASGDLAGDFPSASLAGTIGTNITWTGRHTFTNIVTMSERLDVDEVRIDGSFIRRTSGVARHINLQASSLIFNDGQDDIDVRFKSNTGDKLLFLDAGANRMGVGLDDGDSIASRLDVADLADAFPTIRARADSDGGQASIESLVAGATKNPRFATRRTRGTIAAPTTVADTDVLGDFEFFGHDGTDLLTVGARIRALVNGVPATNRVPTDLEFYTAEGAGDDDIAIAFKLDKAKMATFYGDVVFDGEGDGLLFAEICAQDAADTITIALSGKANKVQITSFDTDGLSNGMTPDHTSDHVTVNRAGKYECIVALGGKSAAGAGALYGFSVYKNNGATEFGNVHNHRRLSGGGGDEGAIPLSGIIDLAVSDTIELWAWNETNTTDLIIDDVTMHLKLVGGT